MTSPLISIITVTFNSDLYLQQTIDSVFSQTYHNIEYIIVDGGSEDDTLAIIKKSESKFKGRLKWISENDNGIYDAMNKGIKMATGNIIGIINSDDFYHRNDIIAKIANTFTDDKIQALFADIRFVNPNSLDKTIRYYSSKKFKPNLFRFGFMPAHPSFFTYKYNFETYGFYKTNYKIAADYELLIRFLYKNKLKYKYLELDVLKMRTGGVSTSSWENTIILNKEIVRACKENGINTNLGLLSFKYFIKVFELIFTK